MFVEGFIEKQKNSIRSDMFFLHAAPMELHFERQSGGYIPAAPLAL
jgi:hypothetical protein